MTRHHRLRLLAVAPLALGALIAYALDDLVTLARRIRRPYWCAECWRAERAAGASVRYAWSVARGHRT